MTLDDAVKRAHEVWGKPRVLSVMTRMDGAAEVYLFARDGKIADTTHRIERDGSVTCHPECVPQVTVLEPEPKSKRRK